VLIVFSLSRAVTDIDYSLVLNNKKNIIAMQKETNQLSRLNRNNQKQNSKTEQGKRGENREESQGGEPK
jgi:hypothetical protein